METITKNDSRISAFFDSLNRISNSLECLLKDHKPMLNNERYIADKELSRRLKVHSRTLEGYRKNGILPYISFGKKILYKESDVQKFLESRNSKVKSKNTDDDDVICIEITAEFPPK